MSKRNLAILSLVCAVGTILWVVLMIAGGPAADFEAALAKALRQDNLYTAAYLNAAFLVTIPATMWMAGLYGYCRPYLSRTGTLIGLVFIPVYTVFNLTAYLSQITLVPQLVVLYQQPETQALAEALLRLSLQESPGSAAAFFNNLAYALLGIPSILFGLGLYQRDGRLFKWGGALLAANGVACLLGASGMLAGLPALELGTVIGGGLFLLALLPLTAAFFQEHANSVTSRTAVGNAMH